MEKIQQRSYERIKPMLLIYSVIALYIMTITFMGRALPEAPCNLLLSEDEWKMLYRIIHKTKHAPDKPYLMAEAVKYSGQLGGYRRAPSDGAPGLQSIWQGLFALYFSIDFLMCQVYRYAEAQTHSAFGNKNLANRMNPFNARNAIVCQNVVFLRFAFYI